MDPITIYYTWYVQGICKSSTKGLDQRYIIKALRDPNPNSYHCASEKTTGDKVFEK